jgi:antitoxin PrlF
MNELTKKTARELSALLARREISAEQAYDAYAAARGNAYVTNADSSARAKEIDRRRAAGEKPGALAGVPYGLEDRFSTKGIPTACGSKMLENYIPPFDATVYEKLQAGGSVLLGKLNMDEFGCPGENAADGGGRAAATDAWAFALGVDTGGKVAFDLRGGQVVVSRSDAGHEDPTIGAFLGLLEADIRAGRHIASLPADLAHAMLANAGHAVDLDENIDGEVAL